MNGLISLKKHHYKGNHEHVLSFLDIIC